MSKTIRDILENIVPCQDCGGYVSDHDGVQGDCNYEAGAEVVDQALSEIEQILRDELPEEKVGTETIPLDTTERGYNIAVQDINRTLPKILGNETKGEE